MKRERERERNLMPVQNIRLKLWLDGTGYDPTKDSEWVLQNGGASHWPGCGSAGKCMPCGKELTLHGRGATAQLVCETYLKFGCPTVRNPAHDFSRGSEKHLCAKCGDALGWISQKTGVLYKTKRLALLASEDEKDLIRPSREVKS
jgi:hypothetical protein